MTARTCSSASSRQSASSGSARVRLRHQVPGHRQRLRHRVVQLGRELAARALFRGDQTRTAARRRRRRPSPPRGGAARRGRRPSARAGAGRPGCRPARRPRASRGSPADGWSGPGVRARASRRTASACSRRRASASRVVAMTAARTTTRPANAPAPSASRCRALRPSSCHRTTATTPTTASTAPLPSSAAQTASGSPERNRRVTSGRRSWSSQCPRGRSGRTERASIGEVAVHAGQLGVGREGDRTEQRGDRTLDEVQLLDDVIDAALRLRQPSQPVGRLARGRGAPVRWQHRCRRGRGRCGQRLRPVRSRC